MYKRQELEEVKYTGNEGLFMHIWINRLDNAIKFSPSKGTITMFLKQEQDSVKSVSYTHLDVYKRQMDGSGWVFLL